VHPETWLGEHSVEAGTDLASCAGCHGSDFNGSGQIPGCFDCHLGEAPTFTTHPTTWANVETDHQGFPSDHSWTTCATAQCHGSDLRGGGDAVTTTGPSCFTATGCHTTTGNYPPAAHPIPNTNPAAHGPDAKNLGQLFCQNCHGLPLKNFDGGYVTDAFIGVNVNDQACSSVNCHPDAKAHPTNWQGTNDSGITDQDPTYSSTHRNVNQAAVNSSCALCHKTTAIGSGPLPGAPSCFSTNFTNANGIASNCHPNGPGVAPHATDGTYRNADVHGPDAKADLGLDFCKSCHAQPDGSSYRFNVPIGTLTNGCEDCHLAGTAHPDADRWTFRGTPTSTRRTHFASTDTLTNCTLCHGVNLNGGGTGPSCNTCHVNAGASDFALDCTICHGSPPDGSVDLTGAPTPVDHLIGLQGDVSAIGSHFVCATCHGASEDTLNPGQVSPTNGNYILFDSTNAPQGGDHLDGEIEMNGPASTDTGAAYDAINQGCNLACHLNDAAHQMPNNSGLPIEYGDYGGGSGVAGCAGCHGYPPDGTADLSGGTPVSHFFADNGTTLLANHNECQTCHGTKDDGTGSHDPAPNYNPLTDHNVVSPSQIQINSALQYVSDPSDPQFGGCNSACHPNDTAHRFPNSSGLTIVEGNFGGISCSQCHDTGVGGAPVVQVGDPHAGSACESCHPGGLVGALHSDGGSANVVLIPNNPTVGINYSANGETGIYLGGEDTLGTTEAEICWNCHNQAFVNADWRDGDDYNNVTAGYTISNRNWTLASFQPPGNILPNRPVASIHSVNASAEDSSVASNVNAFGVISVTSLESAGDIRCSYCHDVHDLNVLTSDNSSGKPYLRGTWLENPYPQERPPQSGETWAANNWSHFDFADTTPRLRTDSADANTGGGYQIDQNNNYPTAGWTLSNSAGLCTLCHGTNVNNMDYYVTSSLWIGTNGHSNSTIGGTGTNASDLFDARDRDGNLNTNFGFYMAGQGADTPTNVSRWGDRNVSGVGRRADVLPYGENASNDQPDDGNNSGTSLTPPRYTGYWGGVAGNVRAVENMPADYNGWYAAGAIGSSPSGSGRAHDFSCSKCHSPHAAGLPALLITNCLDYSVSTWSAQGRNDNGTNVTIGPTTTNQWAKEAMNNCHRKDGTTTGWNSLAPGQ
jgi:hypothetical protein